MSLPQKYGSASSYAKKYALGNLFAIDNTADADATNTHGKGSINVTTDKAELKENSQAYLKVVTALKSKKFTVADVEAKYKVSSELKNKLKNI